MNIFGVFGEQLVQRLLVERCAGICVKQLIVAGVDAKLFEFAKLLQRGGNQFLQRQRPQRGGVLRRQFQDIDGEIEAIFACTHCLCFSLAGGAVAGGGFKHDFGKLSVGAADNIVFAQVARPAWPSPDSTLNSSSSAF